MRSERKRLIPNITREEFRNNAADIAITVDDGDPREKVFDGPIEATEYSTGSLGWQKIGRVHVKVGNKHVLCQMNVILTVLGSKNIPTEEELARA